MATDNKMDVDENTASTNQPLSRTKHASPDPSIAPPNAKRPRNDLPLDQLTTVNDSMKRYSDLAFWPQIFEASSDEPGPRNTLLVQVLNILASKLSTTDSKSTFLNSLTPADAEQLINNFNENELKEWEAGVEKGVKERDWADLIAHPKLKKQIATHELERIASDIIEEQAKQLYQMFHQEYRGDAVERFMKGLNVYGGMYDPNKYFGRTIPLVQSSATGKSRLVAEIGNMMPTLSICFRESDLLSSGWPPKDEPARRFLLKPRSEGARHKGEELAAAFLGAVAYVVGNKIKDQDPSTKDWMADWRLESPVNITNSTRYRCFAEVEAKAEELLLNNQHEITILRQPFNSSSEWHIKLFKLLTRPYFDTLSTVLKERSIKYFMLAFDEHSQLNVNQTPPELGQPPEWYPVWGKSLIALRRIIKAYDWFVSDVPFWFLILDTNLSPIDIVAPRKDASSSRFVESYIPLPPWSFFGFNQMVEKTLSARIKSPTDVLTIEHLKRYGRPYWSTLTDQQVLATAYEKLFSRGGFIPTNADHVFAAFAARAGLEIGQGEGSERLAIQAVGSHMRILKSLVGSLAITVSPSEPMLALAAARALNGSEETYQRAIQTLLYELILKGLVLDRGLLGELSTRILLLRARDQASTPVSGDKRWCKYDEASGVPSVRAVRLSKFLQTMLADNLYISGEKSDVRNKLLDDTSDVWINFTHFVHLSASIDEVTPSMLLEAWSSGFAFQCVSHQPVIDGFIVVYVGSYSLDEPFDISKLFLVPWRTTAKSEVAGLDLAQSLTAPFLVAKDGSRHKPWHLVILFDLGSSSAFGKDYSPPCLTWDTPKRPTGKKNGSDWRGYAGPGEQEAKRYLLNIRGHHAGRYSILQGGLGNEFNQLFKRVLGNVEPGFLQFVDEMELAMERVTYD